MPIRVPPVWLLALALQDSRPASTPASAPASRPATRPTDAQIEREREIDVVAFRRLYEPRMAAIQRQHKGKWVAIADGKLIPHWRDDGQNAGGWRPFDDWAAADRAASHLVPAARHRFVWRIGDEGDRTIDLGMCEQPQILGTACMAAHPMLDRPVFGANSVFQVIWQGRGFEIGVAGPDSRWYVKPALSDPGGTARREEMFCVSSGSQGSLMLRAPVADALGLERWEIPGDATCHGGMWPATICRRACVRMAIKVEGFDLDHVFDAEIWPEGR